MTNLWSFELEIYLAFRLMCRLGQIQIMFWFECLFKLNILAGTYQLGAKMLIKILLLKVTFIIGGVFQNDINNCGPGHFWASVATVYHSIYVTDSM